MVSSDNFYFSCNVAKLTCARINSFDCKVVNGKNIGLCNSGSSPDHKVRQEFQHFSLISNFELDFIFRRTEQFFVRWHCIFQKKWGQLRTDPKY